MNRVTKKILGVAIAVSVLLLLSLSGTGTARQIIPDPDRKEPGRSQTEPEKQT